MSSHRGGLAPPHPETRVGALDVLDRPRVGPPAAVWPDLRWRNGATYDRIASGSTEFLSRDPLVATTRSAYGYVAGNPLNGSDPSGLVGCGILQFACDAAGDVAGGARSVVHEGLELAEIPAYGAYYVAQRTDSSINQLVSSLPGPLQVAAEVVTAPVHVGLDVTQVAGLYGDIGIDMLDNAVQGNPGASPADEGKPIHIGPNGTGPLWYGPGLHPNGRQDFSWNHPYPWSEGVDPNRDPNLGMLTSWTGSC